MIPDERFEEQLRQDLARLASRAGRGPAPSGMLVRLRRRTVRRRLLAGAAGATFVAAGALVALLAPGVERPTPAPGPGNPAAVARAEPEVPTDSSVEMARLEAEIQLRWIVVRRMQRAAAFDRRMKQLRGELYHLAAGDQIARDIDEVAALVVNHGDSLRDAGQRDEAIIVYEDVVRLFPKNRYAADARKRLDEMKQPNCKGDT